MSKIPQGDWNAIAARYQNGELISNIARGYGCTPPAIHYILKRSGARLAETASRRREKQRQRGSRPAPRRSIGWRRVPPADKSARMTLSSGSSGLVRASASAAAAAPGQPVATGQPVAERDPGEPEPTRATPAATPGLDSELHNRAEAAIATFRSSFDRGAQRRLAGGARAPAPSRIGPDAGRRANHNGARSRERRPRTVQPTAKLSALGARPRRFRQARASLIQPFRPPTDGEIFFFDSSCRSSTRMSLRGLLSDRVARSLCSRSRRHDFAREQMPGTPRFNSLEYA